MSQSCFSLGFFSRVSLSTFSLEALNISWVWGVFILVCVWNAKVNFSNTELAGGLASRLDWAASSSRKLTEWLVWTCCPVVLQLAWCFNFSPCLARVQLLVACKLRATREVQSRVPATLHKLEHFFTLSHTLPLHDSHLNTRLLIAKIQANLVWNKANKMVD